jgi:multifunctional beta-oxidation protein
MCSRTLVRVHCSIEVIETIEMNVTTDDGRATHPTTSAEGMAQIMANLENTAASTVGSVVEKVKDVGKALKSKL